MQLIVQVALDTPLDFTFDYRWIGEATDSELPKPGQLVLVPFGQREVVGLIVTVKQSSEVPSEKLRGVIAVQNLIEPLSDKWLEMCRFAASYYQRPLGEVALPCLPKNLRVSKPAAFARALEALEALPPGAGRRTHALRLKLQALRMARQPLAALQTARLLANHQAFSPVVAQSLLRSLAAETLEAAHDVQQLRRLWGQFDPADRRDATVTARAASRAVQLDAADDARQWLRPFWERLSELPREDREQVALALIEARGGIGADWLPRLESASQAYGHEAAVVAAVGMVFAERQLWGKARRLLEQAAAAPALPSRTRRAALRQLAALAREEGDEARALQSEHAAAGLD